MLENLGELTQGAREVRVEVRKGDLTLRVASGAEPHLTWDSHGDPPPVVERSGDVLWIKQVDDFFGHRGMDVKLTLPPAEVFHLKTGHGDVDASGVTGTLRVESGHGDLEATDSQGELHLSTGHGDVGVHRAEGRLRVNSGNGDVELKGVVGAIDANTGRGEIEVELVGASELRANSGMGEIGVTGGSLLHAKLSTGKGDLECSSPLEPGKHVFNTGFGDVSAMLPADARARVDLQTGFGAVVSDFALVRVGRTGPMGFGGARFVGSIGEGEPEIELSVKTGKGDLKLGRLGGPNGRGAHERVSVDVQAGWKDERRGWRGFGADLAATISAEVASAISSGLGGAPPPPRPPGPPPAPRVEVIHPRPAPPPRPPDLSGAVRSTQSPIGPDAPPPPGEDPTMVVLQAVARGEVTPEEAELLLKGRRSPGGGPI
jgi:DUF4097 and DUF4098 domain-containing protein YvlB